MKYLNYLNAIPDERKRGAPESRKMNSCLFLGFLQLKKVLVCPSSNRFSSIQPFLFARFILRFLNKKVTSMLHSQDDVPCPQKDTSTHKKNHD